MAADEIEQQVGVERRQGVQPLDQLGGDRVPEAHSVGTPALGGEQEVGVLLPGPVTAGPNRNLDETGNYLI
jgi:hypothetical protein